MLTFLSPLFLLGLLTAAIPLLIHLSRSRRTKTLRFSTTRFFTDQFLRSYRMSRLKELLLLACRMAVFALFALALARPIVMPRGGSTVRGGSRSLVLVIDNSASMGYVEDGKTLLDRARGVAKELIGGLGRGDSASVVLAGRRAAGPEVLFREPTTDLGDVIQAIDDVKVATLGTNLAGAVRKAETIARAGKATGREVVVLSDLQESGLGLQTDAEAPRDDVSLTFVHIKPKSRDNLAITAVQYAAARPMAGVPFAIRPHVAVQGDAARAFDVRLTIDGKAVGERKVERLANGRWAAPRFHHTFAAGGWHSGSVEVRDPALPGDNRRDFAFEVLDGIKVLAVDGAPSRIPRLDELFFLKTALTAGAEGKGPIQFDAIAPGALDSTDLGPYPLVILANVEAVPPAAVEVLERFADRGGSVLIFAGDKVDASAYNRDLAAPTRLHGGLLPGRLLAIEGNPAGPADAATLGAFDADHPALAAFAEPESAGLAGIGFRALWGIDPGRSAVLMRADTGSPLLCEKPFGKGRVVLFAAGCDRDWTEFPVRPAFLPWVHWLVGYLAQGTLGRQGFFATGDAVRLPLSAVEGLPRVVVKAPDGTLGRPTPTDDPDHPLAFADTGQVGVYTLLSPDKPDAARRFAVNLEAAESNLTYLDDTFANQPGPGDRTAKVEAGLRELLTSHPSVRYVDDPARAVEVIATARRGRRLWDVFLWAVLALALFEPWLANRISRRHYARPGDSPRIEAHRPDLPARPTPQDAQGVAAR